MASGQQAAKESPALPHSASSLALPSLASGAHCCSYFIIFASADAWLSNKKERMACLCFQRKYKSQEAEFKAAGLLFKSLWGEDRVFTAQGINSNIAWQQNTIHNTQEDVKGWSRVGPAWLLQISKDNMIIMSLSGQSYRGLEWCVWWEVAL